MKTQWMESVYVYKFRKHFNGIITKMIMKVVQSHNSKESFKSPWMQTVNWRTTNVYFIQICPFLLGRGNNYRKVLIQLKSK